MTRSKGEVVRLTHALSRLRSHIDGIELGMRLGGPIGAEAAQGVAHTGVEVAMLIAKYDAFWLAELDAASPPIGTGEAP